MDPSHLHIEEERYAPEERNEIEKDNEEINGRQKVRKFVLSTLCPVPNLLHQSMWPRQASQFSSGLQCSHL